MVRDCGCSGDDDNDPPRYDYHSRGEARSRGPRDSTILGLVAVLGMLTSLGMVIILLLVTVLEMETLLEYI